jgi:hypothetical protein
MSDTQPEIRNINQAGRHGSASSRRHAAPSTLQPVGSKNPLLICCGIIGGSALADTDGHRFLEQNHVVVSSRFRQAQPVGERFTAYFQQMQQRG